MERKPGLGLQSFQIRQKFKGIGLQTLWKEKEKSSITTEMCTRDIFNTLKNKEMELIDGQMITVTMDNLKMIKWMEKD